MSFFDVPDADTEIRCLGCGATFEGWRDLCAGDAHAPDCERPGEVFR